MQTAKKIAEPAPVWTPAVDTPVRLAGTDAAATASPAAQLQDQLYEAFAQAEAHERWSYRRTAAFLLVTCGGFWASVIWAVTALA